MIAQDSTHPTGVAEVIKTTDHVSVTRARNRKANAAIGMKLAGAKYEEIAQVLGYPTARAALQAVERALEKEFKETDRKALRRLASARLERLLMAVWPKAVDPDSPEQMAAQGRAKDLVDRHIKLWGLDAPTEIVVHNPTVAEIEQFVARITASTVPDVEEFDILDGEYEEIEAS